MKTIFKLFLLLTMGVLGLHREASAQQRKDSSIVQLSGYVMDSVTKEPVSFITIQIRGSDRGMISNSQGFFSLAVRISDTLLFTGVGYRSQKFVVAKHRESGSLLVTISLAPSIYMLQGITIRLLTRERFKYEFLTLKLPKVPEINPAALIRASELNLPPPPPGLHFSPSEILSEIPFIERATKKKRSKKFVDQSDPNDIPIMK